MLTNLRRHFALPGRIALVSLAISTSPHAGELYGVSFGLSKVYRIDTGTGAATLLSATGEIDLSGIAFDGAGMLHALNNDGPGKDFFRVDAALGTTTLIADLGVPGGEGALAFDGAGNWFYGTTAVSPFGLNHELVRIAPVSGAATVLGNMGFVDAESDVSGMTVLPSGVLLGFDSRSALPDRLVQIDKVTGLSTVIGDIGPVAQTSVGGLAHDPDTGVTYLSDGLSLWTVDPLTGAGTLVGAHGLTGELISGLAVQPEPPPSCLIGIDLAQSLWNVSSTSGAGSFPRPTVLTRFSGLAKSPTGVLYALRESPLDELHVLDPLTGTPTLVGPLGIELVLGGLDFDPISGQLFGVGGSALPGQDCQLFTIDTGTGAATLVGPVVDQFGNAIFASALAFDASGDLFVLKVNASPPEIYHVDPLTAAVSLRVPLAGVGTSFDGGMDFDDFTGALYLCHGGVLYSANPFSGATTALGTTPASMALEVDGTCGIVPLPPGALRPIAVPVLQW